MEKLKERVINIFALPQRLGILQRLQYSQSEYIYAGVVIAEGCKKGICIKYKAEVKSKDGRRWILPKMRREEKEEGELKQQVSDALWDLAERGYDVEIQYECYEEMHSFYTERRCYPVVLLNGIKVEQPADCRTAEECADAMIQLYKLAKEPPPPPPEEVEAERLLQEWPELEVWGLKWIKSWIYAKKRLVAIAELMQSHQWIKNMIAERKDDLSPFDIRAYVSKDKAEVCVSLKPFEEIYCSSDGTIRKIELERKGWDESGTREVYRLKGLLAFAKNAKEYVKIL